MTIELIGVGSAPGDNTGDGLRTGGTKVNNNFTNVTHAASKLVGTATGEIPTADDLDMVGNTNYTTGNLNQNIFGANGANDAIGFGWAVGATSAIFILPISLSSNPSSITISNTFEIRDGSGSIVASGLNTTIILSQGSSHKVARIVISGLALLTSGQVLELRTGNALSKITVNS